jgi:hypothetical protein
LDVPIKISIHNIIHTKSQISYLFTIVKKKKKPTMKGKSKGENFYCGDIFRVLYPSFSPHSLDGVE